MNIFNRQRFVRLKVASFFILTYALAMPFTHYMLGFIGGEDPLPFIFWMVQLVFLPLLGLLIFISRRIHRVDAKFYFTMAWTLSAGNFLELFASVLYDKKDLFGTAAFDLLGNTTLLLPIWLLLGVLEFMLLQFLIPPLKKSGTVKYAFYFSVGLNALMLFFFSLVFAMLPDKYLIGFILLLSLFFSWSIQRFHQKKIKHPFLVDYILCSLMLIIFECIVNAIAKPHEMFTWDGLVKFFEYGFVAAPILFSPFLVLIAVVNYKLIGTRRYADH